MTDSLFDTSFEETYSHKPVSPKNRRQEEGLQSTPTKRKENKTGSHSYEGVEDSKEDAYEFSEEAAKDGSLKILKGKKMKWKNKFKNSRKDKKKKTNFLKRKLAKEQEKSFLLTQKWGKWKGRCKKNESMLHNARAMGGVSYMERDEYGRRLI